MSKSSPITLHQVAAAKNALRAEGKTDTSRAILQITGGSLSTIGKFKKELEKEDASPGTPSKSVQKLAAEMERNIKDSFQERLEKAEEDRDAYLEELESSEKKLDEVADSLKATKESYQQTLGKLEEKELFIKKLEEELRLEKAKSSNAFSMEFKDVLQQSLQEFAQEELQPLKKEMIDLRRTVHLNQRK